MKFKLLLAAALTTFAARASELDGTNTQPSQIIVQVNPTTHESRVFKAQGTDRIVSDAEAAQAVTESVKDSNKIEFKAASELDQSTSTQAWVYWYPRNTYAYCNYGVYSYYYPTYTYVWGGYSYYWYYRY